MDGTILIADHCNQGFAVLREVEPFSTHAYLTDSHGTAMYECVALIPDGVNNGNYVSEPGGRSVGWDYPCSLVTYTCNEGKDADTITIAIWYRVPEETDI